MHAPGGQHGKMSPVFLLPLYSRKPVSQPDRFQRARNRQAGVVRASKRNLHKMWRTEPHSTISVPGSGNPTWIDGLDLCRLMWIHLWMGNR